MCGYNRNITIFWQGLIHKLEGGEMVGADRGYCGELGCIHIPVNYLTPLQKKQNTARVWHETVKCCLKQFCILANCIIHHVSATNMSFHKTVFEVTVVITQLDINCGKSLFQVKFY